MDRYSVVKQINGTWNVRDSHTGEWVPDAVWQTKHEAGKIARILNQQQGAVAPSVRLALAEVERAQLRGDLPAWVVRDLHALHALEDVDHG